MAGTGPIVYPSLLPAAVATAETRQSGDPAVLFPVEAEHVGRAVDKRIREFAAGRACARLALATFGIIDFPLAVAPDRRPIWPQAMIGSITHTAGFCAAAVAPRNQYLNIGIDSEVVAPVSESLREHICIAAEIDWIYSLPRPEQTAATMLVFSVKEAVYKCQYGIVGEWLDFADICVELDAWRFDETPAEFTARPTRPVAIAHRVQMPLRGLYRLHDQFVSAGIALVASDAQ